VRSVCVCMCVCVHVCVCVCVCVYSAWPALHGQIWVCVNIRPTHKAVVKQKSYALRQLTSRHFVLTNNLRVIHKQTESKVDKLFCSRLELRAAKNDDTQLRGAKNDNTQLRGAKNDDTQPLSLLL